MKILLVNTSDKKGGAAIACNRLFYALKKNNIDVKTAVQEKLTDDQNVIRIGRKKFSTLRLYLEKFFFFFKEKSKELRFAYSTARFGKDITQSKAFKSADIIHLHWINLGFISLRGLKKIIRSGKPIVWTLHDMWAFTGGCHYSGDCYNFREECGNCIFLSQPKKNDISKMHWKHKKLIYKDSNIQFVTCSKWLAGIASGSSLLKNMRITSIPNPIDIEIYQPVTKTEANKALGIDESGNFRILFGAASLNDKRKGMIYFIEALKILHQKYKETCDQVEILLFGKLTAEAENQIPFKIIKLGYLNNEKIIASAYSASDLFILTSLQDNLPNTVMEAMACGIPVAAFKTGGVPEMVDHQINGYLVDYMSPESVADGIIWLFNHTDKQSIRLAARKKVVQNYTENRIADQYKKIYLSLHSK